MKAATFGYNLYTQFNTVYNINYKKEAYKQHNYKKNNKDNLH